MVVGLAGWGEGGTSSPSEMLFPPLSSFSSKSNVRWTSRGKKYEPLSLIKQQFALWVCKPSTGSIHYALNCVCLETDSFPSAALAVLYIFLYKNMRGFIFFHFNFNLSPILWGQFFKSFPGSWSCKLPRIDLNRFRHRWPKQFNFTHNVTWTRSYTLD